MRNEKLKGSTYDKCCQCRSIRDLISNSSTVSYKQRLGRALVDERDDAFSLHKGKQVQSKLSPIKLHMPKHSRDDHEEMSQNA